MPTSPVNDRGAVVFYEDTGAPQGSDDYLTLVFVHGVSFHGAIFRRILPTASARNMRVIRMNLRDYPGSSRYSPNELAALSSPDIFVQTAATMAHGKELCAFLLHVIKTLKVPAVKENDGIKQGGIALVTWSMSNIHAFSFLGNTQEFREEEVNLLSQYLRTVVLYDPAISSLGLPPPEDVYSPWRDPTFETIRAKSDAFAPWVSSYFERVVDLDEVSASALATRGAVQDDPDRSPTVLKMSQEELEAVIDFDVVERSSWRLFSVARPILNANFCRAVLDTSGVWPDAKLLLIWCDQSMHHCIWAAKTISELARQPSQDGCIRRKLETVRFQGNHFPHWDSPDTIVDVLATYV